MLSRDFYLSITHGMRSKYHVASRSSGAEAREETNIRVVAAGREAEFEHAVSTHDETQVRIFGSELFDDIFTGQVRDSFIEARTAARRPGLRVRLCVEPAKLARLPWEFLFDSKNAEYLGLSDIVRLVRSVPVSLPLRPVTAGAPVRILGMIANPSTMPKLRVKAEVLRIKRALRDSSEKGNLEIAWVRGQTLDNLAKALISAARPFHVFHFVGHGGLDNIRNMGYLLFSDKWGKPTQIDAPLLANLLAQMPSIRLAVLNSCEGATNGKSDIYSGLCTTLLSTGIPSVVAMRGAVDDTRAISFAGAFYKAIAAGEPVDASVAAARSKLLQEQASRMDWGMPVLYMRCKDGVLFRKSRRPPQCVERPISRPAEAGDISVARAHHFSVPIGASDLPFDILAFVGAKIQDTGHALHDFQGSAFEHLIPKRMNARYRRLELLPNRDTISITAFPFLIQRPGMPNGVPAIQVPAPGQHLRCAFHPNGRGSIPRFTIELAGGPPITIKIIDPDTKQSRHLILQLELTH